MEVDREEFVLLRRLEREVSAHFITPALPEHLHAAFAILMELRAWRAGDRPPDAAAALTDELLP